jgi:hypothetical protein
VELLFGGHGNPSRDSIVGADSRGMRDPPPTGCAT